MRAERCMRTSERARARLRVSQVIHSTNLVICCATVCLVYLTQHACMHACMAVAYHAVCGLNAMPCAMVWK